MFKSVMSSLTAGAEPKLERLSLESSDNNNCKNNNNNSNGNNSNQRAHRDRAGRGREQQSDSERVAEEQPARLRLTVKAGKKRLSSMMGKLRLVSKTNKAHGGATNQNLRRVSGHENHQGHDDADDADDADDDDEQFDDVQLDGNVTDDDDDDDAYTSAEEVCRKASVSSNGAALEACKRRKSSTAAANGGPSQPCAKSVAAAAAAAYEQLKHDKKYVLPEEQCDIPTFLHTKNCDPYLIGETRRLLRERYAKSPEAFYDADYQRMLADDWTVTRFLLRRRLDPKRTAKLMEECGRFRKQYKMSEVELWEFPMEFHMAGGLFKYAPDKVGNVTMYMRVKMYRRVPEISDVFKAFILCVLEQCDVANNGRGTAVVFDLSGCGLQNVDLGFLSWLLSSFRNYCPKGVSYIIVYNLPWILNATCKLAMTWMSASNRRALRFVYGAEIENFIERPHLPDYLGGECKLNYRAIPEGSRPAIEVCERLDMSREQALKIRELFKEYLSDDYDTPAPAPDERQARDEGAEDTDLHPNDTDQTNSASAPLCPVADKGVAESTRAARQHFGPAYTPESENPMDLVTRASKFIAH